MHRESNDVPRRFTKVPLVIVLICTVVAAIFPICVIRTDLAFNYNSREIVKLYDDISGGVDVNSVISAVIQFQEIGAVSQDESAKSVDPELEVIETLLKDNGFSTKAHAMATAYVACLTSGHDKNFAIGLLANINGEGNTGQIEYKNSYSYWNNVSKDVLAIAGKIINSRAMVETLLTGIPDGTKGIGVGSIQWSGGRRVGLLKAYKDKALSYSSDELSEIEIDWMLSELDGSYSSVLGACSGKSPEECAKTLCMKYEVPAHASVRAVERANVATKISNILANVN